MIRIPIVLALALACAACDPPDPGVPLAPPKIKRTYLKDLIPKSTLVCDAEPDGSKIETAIEGAEYIEDLREAGRDCRRKLKAVRGLIQNESE